MWTLVVKVGVTYSTTESSKISMVVVGPRKGMFVSVLKCLFRSDLKPSRSLAGTNAAHDES